MTVIALGKRSSVTVQPGDGKEPVRISVSKLDLTTIKAMPVTSKAAPSSGLVPGAITVFEALQIADPQERARLGQQFLELARQDGNEAEVKLLAGWFGSEK